MSQDWFDFAQDDYSSLDDDTTGTFYCPYTNGAECALLVKGWQPQELCVALECEQLKLFRHDGGRRTEAA